MTFSKSVAAWCLDISYHHSSHQYLLDSYATTAEAVDGMRREEFRTVPIVAPTGEPGTVYFSVSDAPGDSAIFEFIDGKLTIHHGKQYQVMTNSPVFN